MHPKATDLAIITILPEEADAVRRILDNPVLIPAEDETKPNLYAWEHGTIASPRYTSPYHVVLATSVDPTTNAGLLVTKDTVAFCEPRYLLLVGIAGGLPIEGLALGDVVLSKEIWAYEYGKVHAGEYGPRPDFTYQCDRPLIRAAVTLARRIPDWSSGLRQPDSKGMSSTPKVLAGAVASGDKVIDDVSHPMFRAVMKLWPKLQAVEMEGAGAAAAIQACQQEGRQIGFLMVRGISDIPSTQSEPKGEGPVQRGGTVTRDKMKAYASDVAAQFVKNLVQHAWPIPPRHSAPARVRGPESPVDVHRVAPGSLSDLVASMYGDSGAHARTAQQVGGIQLDVYAEQLVLGGTLRIGIRCPEVDKIQEAVLGLESLLKRELLDRGLILAEGAESRRLAEAIKGRVAVHSLKELESSLLSFREYLSVVTSEIERKEVFAKGWYIEPTLERLDPSSPGRPEHFSEFFFDWLDRDDSGLLLVLGGYGTGKTTLTQYLFRSVAAAYVAQARALRAPVLVRLREFNHATSVRGLLTDTLINQLGLKFQNYAHIEGALRSGRLVLFLDGFDEMAVHADASQVIRNFAQILELVRGKAKVVVTSRPSVFPPDFVLEEELSTLRDAGSPGSETLLVPPFGQKQIEQYVSLRTGSTDLVDVIARTYNLMDLGSRPFLLELMVKELPVLLTSGKLISPAAVYESHVSSWFKRDRWRVLDNPLLREFLMEEIATYALVEGSPSIGASEIRELVQELAGDQFERPELRDIETDVKLCSFLERTSKGEFVFSHRSFAEYFLARKLARNIRDEGHRSDPYQKVNAIFNGALHEGSEQVEHFFLDIALRSKELSPSLLMKFAEFPLRGSDAEPTDGSIGSDGTVAPQRVPELLESAAQCLSSPTGLTRLRGKSLFALLAVFGPPATLPSLLEKLNSRKWRPPLDCPASARTRRSDSRAKHTGLSRPSWAANASAAITPPTRRPRSCAGT